MSVGSELHRAREAAGLSLADVASETKIRATLLECIEADDFEACGAPVYVRGHLRSFAASVGLDPEPLIREFDASHESVPVPVLAEALPTSAHGIRERHRPNWLAASVGAAAVITVFLAVTLVAQGGSSPKGSTTVSQKTAPPAVATSAPAAPATKAAPSPTPTIIAQLTPVSVVLKITKAPSWVQESDDGAHSFAQVLAPGTTKIFTGQKQVKLVLGNAGAVDLTVNGKHLGFPGTNGEVVTSTFTPTSTTGQG